MEELFFLCYTFHSTHEIRSLPSYYNHGWVWQWGHRPEICWVTNLYFKPKMKGTENILIQHLTRAMWTPIHFYFIISFKKCSIATGFYGVYRNLSFAAHSDPTPLMTFEYHFGVTQIPWHPLNLPLSTHVSLSYSPQQLFF